MDIARPRRQAHLKTSFYLLSTLLVIAVAYVAVINHPWSGSGERVVDSATVITAMVSQGDFSKTISADGTLVSDKVSVASTALGGTVKAIFIKAGSKVHSGAAIAQLDNPALSGAVLDTQSRLDIARSNLASIVQQTISASLSRKIAVADAVALADQSSLDYKNLHSLHEQGLVADVQYQKSSIDATKNREDVRILRGLVAVDASDAKAKIEAAQSAIAQAQFQLQVSQNQVRALSIVAPSAGIVQSVDVDPGMNIAANSVIAKIADANSLKAVLHVPDNDVQKVAPGMRVHVALGSSSVNGRVTRIAPLAQSGTVDVDVALNGELASARPDASVYGTVELSSMKDALSVVRPAGVVDNSSVDLFKVVPGGEHASRVHVKVGEGSKDRVQIVQGLSRGDTVIVSDMSSQIEQTAIRLK